MGKKWLMWLLIGLAVYFVFFHNGNMMGMNGNGSASNGQAEG